MKQSWFFINDIVTYIGLLVLLFYLFQWRIRYKTAILIIGAVTIAGAAGYALCSLGFPKMSSDFLFLIFFTVPGFLAAFCMAKYRGFRFFFTYCSIDVLGFCINFFARFCAQYSLFQVPSLLLVYLCGYAIYFVLFRRIRRDYWDILENLGRRWGLLCLVSLTFYFLLYFMSYYPKPLEERPEYMIPMALFCLLSMLVCIVMFHTLSALREKDTYMGQLHHQEIYQEYAYKDILTGLFNRRAFEEAMEKKIEKGEALGYAIIDLNNLKKTNDSAGHAEGDKMLQKLAEELRSYNGQIRAYRIGGDEFAVLTEDLNEKEAEELLSKMENSLSLLSAAMGFGWLEDYQEEDVAVFLKQVDFKMYKKKYMMKEQECEKLV